VTASKVSIPAGAEGTATARDKKKYRIAALAKLRVAWGKNELMEKKINSTLIIQMPMEAININPSG
jgi:hypothetical protein